MMILRQIGEGEAQMRRMCSHLTVFVHGHGGKQAAHRTEKTVPEYWHKSLANLLGIRCRGTKANPETMKAQGGEHG